MKFNSKPIPEHEEVPLADEGRLEKIVELWSHNDAIPGGHNEDTDNASYVLSVGTESDPLIRKAQMDEILNLVRTQGDKIVGNEIYHLSKANPRTLLGKGASREIVARTRSCNANLLVIDAELTPSQTRNLEDIAGIAICDREAVILNVFLRHASTRRARIQVEIAQLEYLRPRIRGIGINMDQQAGGISGGRGPGETASELLARKIDGKLAEFKKILRKLESAGKIQRHLRTTCKRIVLVGYTNAGKTSLMNALTSEMLSAKNMPFETLDTTSRCLSRHGGDVLLSDTVGFIRRMPDCLFASFESTLVEICEASLLLIVVDAADVEWKKHLNITVGMLERLGAKNISRFYVFNKLDCVSSAYDPKYFEEACEGYPNMALSSRDEKSVKRLKEALLQSIYCGQSKIKLFVPYTATDAMSLIYSKCRVTESVSTAEGLNLSIESDPQVVEKIKHCLRGRQNENYEK